MYENFTRLPEKEQQRILAACIEEFALHGFTQASTNAIIQKAGIPKGTLFFFFGSKKDLYLYVIDRAVASYTRAFEQAGGDPPADLFERLLYYSATRMQFALREPLLYRLFFNAFTNTPDEIRAALQTRFAGYAQESRRMLFDGLDLSPFRAGVRVEQVVDLIYLVLEGLYSRYLAQGASGTPQAALEMVEQMTGEVREYFELIKIGAYR